MLTLVFVEVDDTNATISPIIGESINETMKAPQKPIDLFCPTKPTNNEMQTQKIKTIINAIDKF